MTLTQSPSQGAAVTFLDPTGSVRQSAAELAPRIPDLAGKVLGIVDDGLPNCDDLLRGVVAEIEQRYELAEIVRVVKPSFSSPLPKADYDDMVRRIDAAVVGVGM